MLYTVRASARGYREQGVASWYGMKFQGRPTANGEIFDVFGATAAHRSLPIPTYVRVTNLGNDRSVVLRVNDRGPFHPDRLIDLSYGAALQLGFAEQGTAAVLVESLDLAGVDDRRELAAASTAICSWAPSPRRLPRASWVAKSGVGGTILSRSVL